MSNSPLRLSDARLDGGPGRHIDGRGGSSTSGETTGPLQPGLSRDPAAPGRERYPTHPGLAISPWFGFTPVVILDDPLVLVEKVMPSPGGAASAAPAPGRSS